MKCMRRAQHIGKLGEPTWEEEARSAARGSEGDDLERLVLCLTMHLDHKLCLNLNI
jgi:hypothetical protein